MIMIMMMMIMMKKKKNKMKKKNYADMKRELYINLPPEMKTAGDVVGLLKKAMYGTRDAAQNWALEYSQTLKDLGFIQGKASPCHFWHPGRPCMEMTSSALERLRI